MSIPSQNSGRVSVIVPARNEEAVIGACVESLAGQAEVGEVLVINDQSTDQTAAIVKKEMESFSKVRLLETKGLPDGWVGKNYAVSVGARGASGEWLLFTDADAVHNNDSVAKALSIVAAERAAMVSFSPEQAMETWYEKALIPYVYCRLARKFSYAEVNDSAKPVAAANGQFLMIRRDAYEAVGGHSSVAGEVVEDVALARRVKNASYRIWFGSGQGVIRVRMYRSFEAMWEGWKKNLYPLMGGTFVEVMNECNRAITPLFLPVLGAIMAWTLARSIPVAFGVFLAALIVIFVADYLELSRNQFPPSLLWYGIPGRFLFSAVLVASYRSYRRGRLEWSGREYPVGTPGASK
jgi:glycosyltransferase involved in cell wall biosynthesis